MNKKELLTVEETASILRVAPNTIYRWFREGRLTGIKIGKEWRIAHSELDRFLKRRTRATSTTELVPFEVLLRRQLTPPEHILVMASAPTEVYRLQAEFLKVGLKAGYPLFVGGWWQKPSEIRARLMAAGMPVADLEASGNLTIGDFQAAYAARGAWGVIEVWREQDRASGGQVLWGTGSHRLSDWKGQLQDLLRFETELHDAFQTMRVVALCPCVLDPVDQPGFEALLDLVPHHSGALFMPGGEPVLMRAAG